MGSLAHRMQPWWPLAALAAALAALGAAHALQRFGGLPPCPLCLKQRDVYWGVAAIAVGGLAVLRFWPRITLRRAIAALLGLGFLTGAIVAFYHVAVEQRWVAAQCDAVDIGAIRTFSVDGTFTTPNCDEIAWSLLGVSLAGYNVLFSLAMAAVSFLIAFAPSPPPEDA
ncbi:MAG: disulfide bond formation protein B [Hyphomonadaceae bacterium]|nr:disulfide bond formation protein B [Hyphomonadaceae bacterium]